MPKRNFLTVLIYLLILFGSLTFLFNYAFNVENKVKEHFSKIAPAVDKIRLDCLENTVRLEKISARTNIQSYSELVEPFVYIQNGHIQELSEATGYVKPLAGECAVTYETQVQEFQYKWGELNSYLEKRYFFDVLSQKTYLLPEKVFQNFTKKPSSFLTKNLFISRSKGLVSIFISNRNGKNALLTRSEDSWTIDSQKIDEVFMRGYLQDVIKAEYLEILPPDTSRDKIGVKDSSVFIKLQYNIDGKKIESKVIIGNQIKSKNEVIGFYALDVPNKDPLSSNALAISLTTYKRLFVTRENFL